MTGRLLDVTTLPRHQTYVCEDGSEIDLKELLDSHYDAIGALAVARLIKANESFGFAMAKPIHEDDDFAPNFWDMPEEYVWFVGGWGPKRDTYIANAVRKMRPLLRSASEPELILSTLDLRFCLPGFFQDVVEPRNSDGTFPWGDFPWGGAVTVSFESWILLGAVSCLSEIQDDSIARLILGAISERMILGNELLSD